MGEQQRTPGHHASAAFHHGQAAHFHHEASKHFQTGKDHAHAAHMALAAHGHALKAIWHGNKTLEQAEAALSPESFKPAADDVLEVSREKKTAFDSATHHDAAANDHEQAAQHYNRAAEHYAGADHAKAAYEAGIAHGYARHAIFHGDEAAKHYVEHYGKSGPTAEIL